MDAMRDLKTTLVEQQPDELLDPDMPNYVATDADFLAAVDIGIADIEAGRTEPFAPVAAELRRTFRPE